MSFFDKLGKTITDTTHTVVEKTKASTDTIRLNGLISDEEKVIEETYRNIGKKYAELHPQDAEPEYGTFFQTIAASQEKIAEYQAQIRKNKHLLLCQSCGAEIPETVLYCTKCGGENPVGKRLAEEKAAQAAAQQVAAGAVEVCQNCGKPRNPGDVFCTGCGTKYGAPVEAAPVVEQPVPPSAESAPQASAAPVTLEKPVAEEPATPTAPVESTVVETAPVAEEKPAETPVPGPGETVCPACNTAVPAQNNFCVNCGAKLPK